MPQVVLRWDLAKHLDGHRYTNPLLLPLRYANPLLLPLQYPESTKHGSERSRPKISSQTPSRWMLSSWSRRILALADCWHLQMRVVARWPRKQKHASCDRDGLTSQHLPYSLPRHDTLYLRPNQFNGVHVTMIRGAIYVCHDCAAEPSRRWWTLDSASGFIPLDQSIQLDFFHEWTVCMEW